MLRNHARAIAERDGFTAGLAWYRRAVVVPREVPLTNAIWLGNALHNRGVRGYAVEAFALGAIVDPNLSLPFANLADKVAFMIEPSGRKWREHDARLPEDITTKETVECLIVCAISCDAMGGRIGIGDSEQYIERAATTLGLDLQALMRDVQPEIRQINGAERQSYAREMYERIKSPMTTNLDPIPGVSDMAS